MRLSVAIALLSVGCGGCRQRPEGSAQRRAPALQRPPVALATPPVRPNPPHGAGSDSLGAVYAPRLLMPDGDYSEWAAGVEGQTWFGLFPSDLGAELRIASIAFEPINACGDRDDRSRRVKVSGPPAPLFLVPVMSGVLPDWQPGPVAPSLSELWLRPGDSRDVRLGAGSFRLEVTGAGESGNVTDYELRLIDIGAGTSQVIFAYHPPPGTDWGLRPMPHVTWAGDLDRDGKPDLLVQDDMSELAGHWVLYLSSAARGRQLVRRVAEYQGVSC